MPVWMLEWFIELKDIKHEKLPSANYAHFSLTYVQWAKI